MVESPFSADSMAPFHCLACLLRAGGWEGEEAAASEHKPPVTAGWLVRGLHTYNSPRRQIHRLTLLGAQDTPSFAIRILIYLSSFPHPDLSRQSRAWKLEHLKLPCELGFRALLYLLFPAAAVGVSDVGALYMCT